MKIITNEEIENLNISPIDCIKWVEEGFKMKYKSQMPPKISIHLRDSLDFFMTMPCLLPEEFGYFGCKNASRFSCTHPSVKSYLMLCDSHNGNFLSLINCDWITSMRTGAVAALAIKTFQKKDSSIYAFMGLGRAGSAALECFIAENKHRDVTIRLLKYKDHAERTIDKYKNFTNIHFEIKEYPYNLIKDADVVVSAITQAPQLLVDDTSIFKPGVLLVPIHTRGFQNCDLFFDKIFGDDTSQISGFQYFSKFKSFNEFSKVLLKEVDGRTNDDERIIAYNIGLGLHDVLFAAKIYNILTSKVR